MFYTIVSVLLLILAVRTLSVLPEIAAMVIAAMAKVIKVTSQAVYVITLLVVIGLSRSILHVIKILRA